VRRSTLSPRAARGLALIGVSLVALAAVIALHVRPGPAAPPIAAAARQPDVASTMDWISDREGWISALDRQSGTSTLFHTADAGRHWSRQRVSSSVETPRFFDSLHGVLGSAAGMFRTSDGGRHWQRLTLPRDADARQPAFADAAHGWVWVASAGLFATADGGARWRRLAAAGLPVIRTAPRLLGFRDGSHGWLALGGALYGTADGGQSWAAAPMPGGGWTAGVYEMGPLSVAADGHGQLLLAGAESRWVAATADGGATWSSPRPLPPGPASLATSRVDGSVSWAWSANELQLTRDGGAHWARVATPVAWSLLRVQALGAGTAWVAASVVDALGAARWTLFWSGDAGLTWIPAIPPSLG
jgi:photosystem II stability/assembly factor-like uncharacterized protein